MRGNRAQDEESRPLVVPVIETEPLKYADLWKASKTLDDAFEFDPLMLYMRAGGPQSPARKRIISFTSLLSEKRKKTVLTVNHGSSFIIASLGEDKPKTPFDSFFELIIARIQKFSSGTLSAEQQKRAREMAAKFSAIVEGTLGDRIRNMFSVDGLATEPANQRKGYASALVEVINGMADTSSKSSWLMALTMNEPFYNSHGYQTIGTCYIGEGNPTWTEKPIAVHVMVRDTQSKPQTAPPRKTASKPFKLNVITLYPEIPPIYFV